MSKRAFYNGDVDGILLPAIDATVFVETDSDSRCGHVERFTLTELSFGFENTPNKITSPSLPPSPPTPAPCGTCRQGVGTPPSLPPVRSFAGIGEFFSVQGRHVHIPAPKICSMKFCGRSYKHSTFVCSGL